MMEEGRLLVNWFVPDGKDWVDVFEALATPVIAALAAFFAFQAYRLERMRREDELFDLRWRLFEDVWDAYRKPRRLAPSIKSVVAHERSGKQKRMVVEGSDPVYWEAFALKAECLFDRGTGKQVRSLNEWRDDDENDTDMWAPNENWLNRPPPSWFFRIFQPKLLVGR